MMGKQKYINFVLTADSNYIMPITVTIASIIKNLNAKYMAKFFIFSSNFSTDNITEFKELQKFKKFKIINIPMKKYGQLFNKVDVSKFALSHTNLVVYYRLLLFKILPNYVDKVFFIDGDIVVDTDLSVIYNDLPKNKLADVVVESFAMKTKDTTLKHLKDIKDFDKFNKEPFKYPYFNAGFMLINLTLARKLQIWEELFNWMNNNPIPKFADQDTLNAVLGQRHSELLQYLSPKYNVFCDKGINKIKKWDNAFYDETEIEDALKRPLVFHYAGGYKPWITNECNYFNIWKSYYNLTPFKNQNLLLNVWKQKKYSLSLFNLLKIFQVVKKQFGNKANIQIKFFNIILLRIKLNKSAKSIYLLNFIPFYKSEVI